MTFKVFKDKIDAIIAKTADNITVFYSHNKAIGKFYARFSDGTVITGCPSGRKVTVRYGSGHQMMAVI